jgi:glycosyltransferase involved in cell wall biosynthesis
MVAVGELTGRKNLALLLEAMARLDRTAPEPWLVVAGDGAERESLVRRASAPDLAGRVRFLGFRDDVPDLLGAADLLVHPSRVEGFGYAVAEAMAAGLPVVATDASSLPEIVTPGTGILFEPENAESLAAAISAYARDPVRRAEDGARGRERVRAEFSRERRNRELEDILAESIAAAGSRSL